MIGERLSDLFVKIMPRYNLFANKSSGYKFPTMSNMTFI
jgi:hypothetical protein